MSIGLFQVPPAENEVVKSYAPGSPERIELKKTLGRLKTMEMHIPMVIGGKEITTSDKVRIVPPHDIHHTLGYYYRGDASHVTMAIESALHARQAWSALSWEQRASVFLKAASLISGPYRALINASTMLGQSKNVFQAEIDAACEMADFLRFNVKYMSEIYAQQPDSAPMIWNRVEQRPLEGFVFALTPFNFTSIAGNLPSAPALMGNTVVWKPSNNQIYSAWYLMEVFREAGVPDGVINLVYAPGSLAGKVIFSHPDFAGIHFTGSTEVFQEIWKTIGQNIHLYKSYPRIVGETGGKNFVVVHPTAHKQQVATALIRGAFEYQGQKCSAASRAYLPESLWPDLKQLMIRDLATIKMGSPEHFSNFFNAVIDESSFEKLKGFIDRARNNPGVELIWGGGCDKSTGYFIEPTVLVVEDPHYETMEEELFGPVLTIYLYKDEEWESMLDLVDQTSPYALTGSVFSKDRYAIEQALRRLVHAAGNFYINDKPTGAVVNQQPFGGARASGTNDKAGSPLNLMRWVSPRTIKETFLPPDDYRYPFQEKPPCPNH